MACGGGQWHVIKVGEARLFWSVSGLTPGGREPPEEPSS